MSGPASLKPGGENWCSTAIKCKTLRTVPLTGTTEFELAHDDGNRNVESKMNLEFEGLSSSSTSFVKLDNSFPT